MTQNRRDFIGVLAFSAVSASMQSATASSDSKKSRQAKFVRTTFNNVEVDGVNVFYRSAGDVDAPVILLLHGFPSSSHMFRELIPRLAGRYRLIAPDFPGFGFTTVPVERNYHYSFDTLSQTLSAFVDAVGIDRYAMYIFDYGAPTGLRLAMAHPERVTAIISQNGNAYKEGLGAAWEPFQDYWERPDTNNRERLRQALTLDTTYWAYTHGLSNPNTVAPESYYLDAALLARPGNAEIQLDLFLDYEKNVKLYPKFQEYFRKYKPQLLAIWGKHDQLFIPAGANAYLRDNPNARVQLLDASHFALETHVEEIAVAVDRFLDPANTQADSSG